MLFWVLLGSIISSSLAGLISFQLLRHFFFLENASLHFEERFVWELRLWRVLLFSKPPWVAKKQTYRICVTVYRVSFVGNVVAMIGVPLVLLFY